MPTATEHVLQQLATYESPNVTFVDPEGGWPIVWERARGCRVEDAEGRRYLDLTAAFGVAAAGHANPAVVRAGRRQMGRLLHAMGDVHPHALKGELAHTLSDLTFGRWTGSRAHGRVILGSSGFEAVEAALKTARIATGRRGILAFEGGYHGLGYGALNATHRELFREPFRNQLAEFGRFVPWPEGHSASNTSPAAERSPDLRRLETAIRREFRRHSIGAILVEPVQARGGIRIPAAGFLPLLRRLADEHGALLVLDEIYTGFGRTGRWFACEHESVVPDLICLGKALTGGFPLSACVGRSEVMQSWPPSGGEAIHTSTFLGHPVGCAMALAQIAELKRRRLPERSARVGARALQRLQSLPDRIGGVRLHPRGIGLMLGVELQTPDSRPATGVSLTTVKKLLERGCIVLPEGAHGEVISFTPPLTISESALRDAIDLLEETLRETAAPARPRTPRAAGRRKS